MPAFNGVSLDVTFSFKLSVVDGTVGDNVTFTVNSKICWSEVDGVDTVVADWVVADGVFVDWVVGCVSITVGPWVDSGVRAVGDCSGVVASVVDIVDVVDVSSFDVVKNIQPSGGVIGDQESVIWICANQFTFHEDTPYEKVSYTFLFVVFWRYEWLMYPS